MAGDQGNRNKNHVGTGALARPSGAQLRT